jgi:hypothetical protein
MFANGGVTLVLKLLSLHLGERKVIFNPYKFVESNLILGQVVKYFLLSFSRFLRVVCSWFFSESEIFIYFFLSLHSDFA